jgi:hypothetical protein
MKFNRQTGLRFLCSLGLILAQGGLRAYDLFHPVPEASLRELNTDRPDKTESPITVDAGHYQLEMDLISVSRDQADGIRSDRVNTADFNFKAGLTDYADIQLGFDPWDSSKVQDLATGIDSTASGSGDFIGRLKVNLWGDNGGATAFGVMPFIKAPTAAPGLGNGFVEGGVILPLALDLGWGFGLGTMAEFDINRNAADAGYHNDTVLSASLSREIVKGLEAYFEYWIQVSGEAAVPSPQTLDGGFCWGFNENIQFDLGVNAASNPAAEDFNPFLGLSVRL